LAQRVKARVAAKAVANDPSVVDRIGGIARVVAAVDPVAEMEDVRASDPRRAVRRV
jgi:hypothetical protein